MYQSTHTGAQVDEAVDKALSADAVPTPGSTNLVQSGGVFGVVSNRNLLDNGWFTVNQRGAGTVTANLAFIADRWKCTYGSGGYTATIDSSGVSISPSSSTSYAALRQILDPDTAAFLVGKTITGSVLLSDGTIVTGTAVISGTQNVNIIAQGTENISMVWGYSSQQIDVRSYAETHTIRAVKLELGSVSTLANDTPPNFAEELAKCQRYLYVLTPIGTSTPFVGTGVAIAGTQASIFVPLPVTMRSAPTPAYSGTVKVWHGATIGSSGINMTGFSGAGLTRNGVSITVTVSSGLTTGEFCMLQLRESSPSITLSAEL